MMELVSRNVSLKPAHRRQIMGWLHIGQQVGNFVMTMTIQRTGKRYEVRADVQDQAGTFMCRSRKNELMDACKGVVQQLNLQLHNQRLSRLAA